MWVCMCIILHVGRLHGDYTAYYILWRPILFSVAIHVLPPIATIPVHYHRMSSGSRLTVAVVWLYHMMCLWLRMYVVLFVWSITHCAFLWPYVLHTCTLYRFQDSVLMPSSQPESQSLHVISSAILKHLSFKNEIYVSSECRPQLIQVPEAQ